jgi:Major Facilitator Superfamily
MCTLLQRNRRYAQSFIRTPPTPIRDASVCPKKPATRALRPHFVRFEDWNSITSRPNTCLPQKSSSPDLCTPFSSQVASLSSSSTKEASSPSNPLAPETSLSKAQPFTPSRLFEYLQLESYQNQEIEAVFDRISPSTSDRDSSSSPPLTVNQSNLQAFLHERVREIERLDDEAHGIVGDGQADFREERHSFAEREARQVMQLLGAKGRGPTNELSLSKEEFVNAVRSKATEIDFRRTLPITASMLLVGSSVGIMSPALPFIVSELGLSSTQFGLTVSAFALSRMLSNVPAAIAVERHGRKPYMTYSLAVVAVATAGVGISGSFEELYLCRFLTGTSLQSAVFERMCSVSRIMKIRCGCCCVGNECHNDNDGHQHPPQSSIYDCTDHERILGWDSHRTSSWRVPC